jgi:hypothetical protein
MTEHTTEAAAVAALVTPTAFAIDLRERTAIVHPNGTGSAALVSAREMLEAYDARPRRREGCSTLADLASFTAFVVRYRSPDSVLFAERLPSPRGMSPGARLLAVFDFHDAGPEDPETSRARFGQHRAGYAFPPSEPWVAWTATIERLAQAQFADFLEDRIVDIIEPKTANASTLDLVDRLGLTLASPARVLELSKGLAVRVNSKVAAAVNLASGEGQFTFATEHQDEAGAVLKIPNAFVISLPVFDKDAPYQVVVRLRYRVKDGAVTWSLLPHDLPRIFAHAFETAAARVARLTDLPLFFGSP